MSNLGPWRLWDLFDAKVDFRRGQEVLKALEAAKYAHDQEWTAFLKNYSGAPMRRRYED